MRTPTRLGGARGAGLAVTIGRCDGGRNARADGAPGKAMPMRERRPESREAPRDESA